MTAERLPRRFTPEEYLSLERASDYKSEFFDGQIYAMSGGTPNHSRIKVNLTREVSFQLKGTPCEAFDDDAKVRTSEQGLFAYPDLSIVCGQAQYHDDTKDVLANPSAIFEVLSPSTEAADRGTKWIRYQTIETLQHYVLISQEMPRVELYTRQPPNRWILETVVGLSDMVTLPTVNVTLSLSELYDRVMFADRK